MQTLTEKYRPREFSSIIGQDSKIKKIESLLNSDFPHLLFHGPPGTGKTTTALAISKKLFPKSFRENVLELNASDSRGISVIRETVKTYAKRRTSSSTENTFKIIILDEADSMTQDAQNALRRVIEENSKCTRFIFCCNYVSKLSSAIISRCTAFSFGKVSRESAVNKLAEITMNEVSKVHIQNKVKEFMKGQENVYGKFFEKIVERSKGDMRKGINYLEEVLNSGLIEEENLEKYLGSIEEDEKCIRKFGKETVENIISGKFIPFYTGVTQFENTGREFIKLVDEMSSYIVGHEKIDEKVKENLLVSLSEIDGRIVQGANAKLQILSFFAVYEACRK